MTADCYVPSDEDRFSFGIWTVGWQGVDVFRGAVCAMQRACAAHGVSLAAAALQFSLRDPRVVSTVVGVSEPSRIGEITALMSEQSPAGLWAGLDSLAVDPEFWLN